MAWINDAPRTPEEIQVEEVRRRLLGLEGVETEAWREHAEIEYAREAEMRHQQEQDEAAEWNRMQCEEMSSSRTYISDYLR